VTRPAIDDAITEYLDAVQQGWRDVCEPREPLDPLDVADASRFLAAIVEGALTFVHADPRTPQFVPWITPDRRWADNGRDSQYWMAPVDGAHRYRIHGTRGGECYLSFTVYAGTPGHPEAVALNVNHLALDAGPGDPYERARGRAPDRRVLRDLSPVLPRSRPGRARDASHPRDRRPRACDPR
jgi:hypothetical protein